MRASEPPLGMQYSQKDITELQPTYENVTKPRLWKQVPAKQISPSTGISCHSTQVQQKSNVGWAVGPLANLKYRKNSQNRQSQIDNSLLSPVEKKKKQKCLTISNFLKQIQMESKDQKGDQQSDLESQIMSILDVNYSQSISSEKYRRNRDIMKKSFMEDKKFHMNLLICVLKEILCPLKQQLVLFFKNSQQQLQTINQFYHKLISKYESELTEKSLQIRHMQLKSRQLRLNISQSTYRLQSKISVLQSQNKSLELKNKQLTSTVSSLQNRFKECQQENTKIKKYSIDLNEMILKYHKKMEEIEIKFGQTKKQYETNLSRQIEKLTQKYKTLLKQQQENYELKIETNRIKYLNLHNANILSTNNISINMSMSKIEDRASNNSNCSNIEEYIPNIQPQPQSQQFQTSMNSSVKNLGNSGNIGNNKMICSVGCVNRKNLERVINPIQSCKEELNESMLSFTIQQQEQGSYCLENKNADTSRTVPVNNNGSSANPKVYSSSISNSNDNIYTTDKEYSHFSPKSATSGRRFERTVKFILNVVSPISNSANNKINAVNMAGNRLFKSNNGQKEKEQANLNYNRQSKDRMKEKDKDNMTYKSHELNSTASNYQYKSASNLNSNNFYNRNTMYSTNNIINNSSSLKNSTSNLFAGIYSGGVYTPNNKNIPTHANAKGNQFEGTNVNGANGNIRGKNIVQVDRKLRETIK